MDLRVAIKLGDGWCAKMAKPAAGRLHSLA
jgi:hypothetical protein